METNKKQTAVDILHSQMMGLICNNELSDREKVTMGHNLFYENKQMEREQMIELVQQLKDYTHESRNILGYDEREASEFVDIFYNNTHGTTN